MDKRPARLRRLELMTRYPQGVTVALLDSLLAAYGQDRLHWISSPP